MLSAKKHSHFKEKKISDHENCLNAAKTNGKSKYLEQKKINVDKRKEFVKNKTILKTQQTFKSESHNVFNEVINKTALSTNDDQRM